MSSLRQPLLLLAVLALFGAVARVGAEQSPAPALEPAPEPAIQPAPGPTSAWSEWAAPGPPLPSPSEARDLALQFLEWDYLADWTSAVVRGESPGDLPGRWARLRELRGVAGAAPAWSLVRRQRGLCLYEQMNLQPPALLVFCDSLKAARYEPVSYLFAGLAEALLLQRAGLPGCGRTGDGADALAAGLPEVPGLSLEALKEGRPFASLYFAAEEWLESRRLGRLERVRQFLGQPGQLISVKSGYRKALLEQAPVPAERLDDDHLLYPEGLHVDWGQGRELNVRALPVLVMPSQHLYQVVEPDSRWRLVSDGRTLEPQAGRFELDGEYLVESAHVTLHLNGGRYRLEGSELRLWLPGNFFEANRNGLLLTGLLLLATLYLLANVRRQRRRLSEPLSPRRPGRSR
jgi:hypothetical protein